MRRVLVAALFGLLLLAAAGCGGGYGGSSKASSSTTTESSSDGGRGRQTIAGVPANDHGTKAVEDHGRTEVELDDYYFKPSVLEGKPGDQVILELKNEGQVEHSFTVDAQRIDQDVQPGDDAEVTVTIPKSGAVSFYCKFHKGSGMAGALAVKGAATGTGTNMNEGNGKGGYDGY
jgi:plastocyanin